MDHWMENKLKNQRATRDRRGKRGPRCETLNPRARPAGICGWGMNMANDNTTPADWAIEMAMKEGGYTTRRASGSPSFLALARRIERTEQPPVDPLVEEAADLAEAHGWLRQGAGHNLALAAIRRGYELGKGAARI